MLYDILHDVHIIPIRIVDITNHVQKQTGLYSVQAEKHGMEVLVYEQQIIVHEHPLQTRHGVILQMVAQPSRISL